MSDHKPPDDEAGPAGRAGAAPRRGFLEVSAAAAGARLLSARFGGGGGEDGRPLPGATDAGPLSRFDHVVVRMPAIALNPCTAANPIVKRHVRHAAVVRTLCERFDVSHRTERNVDAPELRDAINLPATRAPSSWPVTLPLNGRERDFVALAHFTGVEPAPDDIPKTVGVACARLKPYAAGAFGNA